MQRRCTSSTLSTKIETVRLSRDVTLDSRKIIIETKGSTIPDTALPKFFELFAIGEALTPGGDLGVGPPMAYRIFSLYGGSVSVANLAPSGIRLTISLLDILTQSAAPASSNLLTGKRFELYAFAACFLRFAQEAFMRAELTRLGGAHAIALGGIKGR
jgi:hypothetical protein